MREHVPELAGVPDAYLAEPWTMPGDVQGRCSCMIGRDHAEARRQALDRYRIKN